MRKLRLRPILLAASLPLWGLACAETAAPPSLTRSSAETPPPPIPAEPVPEKASVPAPAPPSVPAATADTAAGRSMKARPSRPRAPRPAPPPAPVPVPEPAAVPLPAPPPVVAVAPPPTPSAPRKPLRVNLAVVLVVASLALLFWVRSLSQEDDPIELLGNVGLARVLSGAAAALALAALVLSATALMISEHRLSAACLIVSALALLWLSVGAFSALGEAQYQADVLIKKTEAKRFQYAEQAAQFRVKEWEGRDWSENALVGDLTPQALAACVVAVLGVVGAVLL